MYIKDTFKKSFFLIFTIWGYSQGNKHKHHTLHGVCPHSTRTIEYVSSCPKTEDAWKEREAVKRCEDVKQNCVSMERFVYHCAVNEWRNATLEVCAPFRIIFGRCVEYNVLGKRIQFNRERCTVFSKPCPAHYQSTDVYLYPECFKTISKYTPHMPDDRQEKFTEDRQKKFAEKQMHIKQDSERDINEVIEVISRMNSGEIKYPILSLLSLNAVTALLLNILVLNG